MPKTALFTRISTLRARASTASRSRSRSRSETRSTATTSTRTPCRSRRSSASRLSRSSRRATSVTPWPRCASPRASSAPIPAEAPVTRAVEPGSGGGSAIPASYGPRLPARQRAALPVRRAGDALSGAAHHPAPVLSGELGHRVAHDRQQAFDEQGADLLARRLSRDEPVARGDLEQPRVGAQDEPYRRRHPDVAEVVVEQAVDELVADLADQALGVGVGPERTRARDRKGRVEVGLDVVQPRVGVAGHHLLDREVEVGAHREGRELGHGAEGLEEELALGPEVVVDQRAADTRLVGHVGHVHRAVRGVGEDAPGGLEDVGATIGGIAARPAPGLGLHVRITVARSACPRRLLTYCQQQGHAHTMPLARMFGALAAAPLVLAGAAPAAAETVPAAPLTPSGPAPTLAAHTGKAFK